MKRCKRAFLFIVVFFVGIVFAGAARGATYSCNSCEDCTSKIAAALPNDIIQLTADIRCDSGSACVDFGSRQDVIFDGMGHWITRGDGGYYGIRMPSAVNTGNTIRNVAVKGFSRGIYILYGSGHLLEELRVTGCSIGIDLYSASGNIVQKAHLFHNYRGLYLTYDADNNIIRDSYFARNHYAGITFFPRSSSGDPENNQIYNNVLSNTPAGNIDFTTIGSEEDRDLSHIVFFFNKPLDCSGEANIMGCGCQGGNYWKRPSDTGYSQTCTDADVDGICDTPYTIAHSTANMVDNFPLTTPPAGCCANPDRDGDGHSATFCGGGDKDDDPLACGAACYPGAGEVCDGYDNDGDGLADGTVACQDMILYKNAYLPEVTAHQSCAEDPVSAKIYCFGGNGYASSYYGTILAYDPAADTADVLPTELPSSRGIMACRYDPVSARIFCFGGYSQETVCTAWNEWGGCIAATTYVTRYNQILEFNPADQTLITLSETLPVGMSSMGIARGTNTGTFFLLGGTSSIHSGNRDWIQEFNPATKTFLAPRPAQLPTERFSTDCVENSANGKIYCIGGYDEFVGFNSSLDEIVEFDPATNTVQIMPTRFPHQIQDTGCVEDSVDHLIYCIGGRSGQSIHHNTIQVYDPMTDSITEQPSRLISGRYGHECVEQAATNRVYCFGGASNVVNLSEILEYTPDLPILGDGNRDGITDLDDTLDFLGVQTNGTSPALTRKADVTGNRRLGLPEMLYQLRQSSGPQ